MAEVVKEAPKHEPGDAFVPLPELPGGSRVHHRLTETGAGLLLTGGADELGRPFAEVLCLDPLTGAFEPIGLRLRQPRMQHSATALPGADAILGTADDAVLVVGGHDGEQLLSSIELITPDPDGDGSFADARIDLVPALPLPLADHAACLAISPEHEADIAGILILGGVTAATADPQSVHLDDGAPTVTSAALFLTLGYRPDGLPEARYEPILQPAYARRGHSLTRIPGADGVLGTLDDQVLVYGGIGVAPHRHAFDDELRAVETPEVFETLSQRWSSVTLLPEAHANALPSPQRQPGRSRHRAILTDEGVVIVGGLGDDLHPMREALLIAIDPEQPELGELRIVGELLEAREHPEVAPLSDGRWLIAGGYRRDEGAHTGVVIDTAEVYDPKGDPRFSPLLERMGRPRIHHAMARGAGRIVITGGYDPGRALPLPDAEFLLEAQQR